jgi:hypothetical protein
MREPLAHSTWVLGAAGVIFTLAGSALALGQHFPVVSTFDSGNEGWTINENGNPAAWAEAGGNPGGFIRYVFAGAAPTSILAPSAFLGDWSSLDEVGYIRYDHLVGQETNVQYTCDHRIMLVGPRGSALWNGPPPNPPGSGWASYTVPLSRENWNVTSGTWEDLLADVSFFIIRYELYGNDGIDEEGIDNVYVAPGPRAGDMNCDGAFDGFDIDPFFFALADPGAWQLQFPGCDIAAGDINADGEVDGFDIDPFFALLGG